METPYTKKAPTFEQDLLWSVLDQVAVEHILAMAHDSWGVDPAAAWAAIQEQAKLGRLSAYRGGGSPTSVDLARISLDEASQDHWLFVEPTKATFTRLNEIGGEAG